MKKIGVYIGRFQPLHNGHVQVIQNALENFDYVFVFVGSANKRISCKNPFSNVVRESWICHALEFHPSLRVSSLNDYQSEDKWASELRNKVADYGVKEEDEISLIGYEKDDSSYYLKNFPEWGRYETPYYDQLDATSIRNAAYEKDPEFIHSIPQVVNEHLWASWINSEDYLNCREEWQYYEDEKVKFANYPHPETLRFTCSDSVVTCAGHVLLIRRKYAPGKGCLALPGGFVNRGETRLQAAVRELQEETNLRVPEKVLLGSIKDQHLFDDPNRSLGIPRETMAVHFDIQLDPNGKLPRANGSDDADEALWLPLSQLNSVSMYDDHRDIIEYFTGV